MFRRSAIRTAAVVGVAALGLALTPQAASADPGAPSSQASCVAGITVAETRLAPGFVGQEVKSILEAGQGVFPSLVQLLASHHGDAEACFALAGE